VLGRGYVAQHARVRLPPEADVRPGDRLLAVRGNGYALGLLARGTIYDAAVKHPELQALGS
jgi:hypothetical protein